MSDLIRENELLKAELEETRKRMRNLEQAYYRVQMQRDNLRIQLDRNNAEHHVKNG